MVLVFAGGPEQMLCQRDDCIIINLIRRTTFFIKKKNYRLIFFYLAAPGLSCIMWDLVASPWINQASFIESAECGI